MFGLFPAWGEYFFFLKLWEAHSFCFPQTLVGGVGFKRRAFLPVSLIGLPNFVSNFGQ